MHEKCGRTLLTPGTAKGNAPLQRSSRKHPVTTKTHILVNMFTSMMTCSVICARSHPACSHARRTGGVVTQVMLLTSVESLFLCYWVRSAPARNNNSGPYPQPSMPLAPVPHTQRIMFFFPTQRNEPCSRSWSAPASFQSRCPPQRPSIRNHPDTNKHISASQYYVQCAVFHHLSSDAFIRAFAVPCAIICDGTPTLHGCTAIRAKYAGFTSGSV